MVDSEAGCCSGAVRERRVWGYICDRKTADSLAPHEQRAVIVRLADAMGRSVERLFVEETRQNAKGVDGQVLRSMIDELEATGASVILLISGSGVLAPTRAARTRRIAALLSVDVVLKDPSGELHPSPTTVAIARTAAAVVSIELPHLERGSQIVNRRSATRTPSMR